MKTLITKAMKIALRIVPVAFIPWSIISPQGFFWGGSKLKPNIIDNRVHQIVLESNSPCEDRRSVLQLMAIEGYAAAVYDGHGGWQVSDLCSKDLLIVLDKCLSSNKQANKYSNVDELITESIKLAFQIIEQRYIHKAKIAYELGFGRAARVGSCALVCVVHGDKLYVGNAGDSKGIVIEQNKPMGYVQTNRFLNADNPEEQKRLKQAFPNQDDIFVCKRPNKTSCYVKGRLQPTRSIGDLRLKLKQFNNPQGLSREHQFQPPLKNFSGNYITAQPEIKIIPLNKKQKWVLLASDGLWDQLGIQEVAQVFKSTPVDKIPGVLVQKCLQKAAQDNKMTVNEIKAIPQGKKRKIHDDISIVVLDLQGQVK